MLSADLYIESHFVYVLFLYINFMDIYFLIVFVLFIIDVINSQLMCIYVTLFEWIICLSGVHVHVLDLSLVIMYFMMI